MADEESGPYPQVNKELRWDFEKGWERGQIKSPVGWDGWLIPKRASAVGSIPAPSKNRGGFARRIRERPAGGTEIWKER